MKRKILSAFIFLLLVSVCPCLAQENELNWEEELDTLLAEEEIKQQQTQQPTEITAYKGPAGTISLDIKGMDIVDVLKMLSNRANLNVVVGKNVTGRVTLFLKDVDIWDAFEIVLLANDLAYEKKGDIINVMTQRDYELIYGERHEDKREARIVKLQYAKAADLGRSLNQIKTNVGKIVADETSNTLVLIDSVAKINEMLEFIEKTDLPVETKIFSLNYAQAEKLNTKLQEVITKGVGSVSIDERTNKIAVTDYPKKVEEIKKMVAAFDEKPRQVLIDMQIVEITPKDQYAMGIDWDFWIKKNARLAASLAAPLPSEIDSIPNKISFGVAAAGTSVSSTTQYKSVIDMLRVIGETKILSSPRIMAINNQEAKILVGTKEAYIESTTSQTGETAVTSQSVNFVDVGIKLFVTPTVNEEGFVTMKIRPEISSSVSGTLTSEDKKTSYPKVTTSETETTIMVKDNTTIIIAGLKKDKREVEEKKVPFLGDIPLLGALFKNKKDDITKSELVIFITPHIVTGDEPLEYSSLDNDKDIAYIQAEAKARHLEKTQMALSQDMQSSDYRRLIVQKVNASGRVNAPKDKKGRVDLEFYLNANGSLDGEPKINYASDPQLAEIAVESIKQASPFQAFPEDLEKDKEKFRITIDYE